MRLTRRSARLRVVLAATTIAFGVLAASSSQASGAPAVGWLRLAHLSPNTPPVDVYLYSFGDPSARLVLRHVAYGTVSPYLAVVAGDYTVAMRSQGAAATAAPVLSTGVNVAAGHAYTVAGMGPLKGLRLQVLRDRLTTPSGRALVRVIQASMHQHVVSIRAGAKVLAGTLAFGSVTSYQVVAPGKLLVNARGTSESAGQRIALAAGTIHTIAVLDSRHALKLVSLTDAAGSGTAPIGPPATGLGGTAPRPGPSPLPWLTLMAAGTLAAAVGLIRRRRSEQLPLRAR
jgi:hypothetical protein